MEYSEKINVIVVEPSDLEWITKKNIGEIAGAITFWDNEKSILPNHLPSIFSHSWYWNEEGRFIDINEQWPIQVFAIESQKALNTGIYKNIKFSESAEFLIGSLEIDEILDNNGDELVKIAEQAYNEIYELMQKSWKETLVRVWNYVTDILWETTITVDGNPIKTNRYRAFCTWRSLSIDNTFKLTTQQLPTATWIGNHLSKKGVKIFFIATNREDVQNHKNPKQTNPSDYDKEIHGIKEIPWIFSTPRFNRATSLSGENMLFVWWTASILGQEVVYEWNVVKQTWQSLQNMRYTMEEAAKNTWIDFTKLPIVLKVFVKDKNDFDAIKIAIESQNNILSNIIIDTVYTYGDVCRDKWLVEISCETMSLEMAQIILERKLQKARKIEDSLMKKIVHLWFGVE
jgi:hypothetical protein